jgi:hypothetical protein
MVAKRYHFVTCPTYWYAVNPLARLSNVVGSVFANRASSTHTNRYAGPPVAALAQWHRHTMVRNRSPTSRCTRTSSELVADLAHVVQPDQRLDRLALREVMAEWRQRAVRALDEMLGRRTTSAARPWTWAWRRGTARRARP